MCVSKSQNSDVETAAGWSRRLVDKERGRSGLPIREAAAVVAARIKATPRSIVSLLREKEWPKDVSTRLYTALNDAVQREIAVEIEALNNEMVAARCGRLVRDPREIAEIEADLARLRSRLRSR